MPPNAAEPEMRVDPDLAALLADAGLGEGFALTLEHVCRPLSARAKALREHRGRTVVIGLCGAQGSGKSTIAAVTARLLASQGLKVAVLSLDDVYLGREARTWLAARTHPLLAVRGPPGTHDVPLACAVLDGLGVPGETPLPRFDKGLDERQPKARWPLIEGPVDVILFEGWCVGARPQPVEALARPVNALEAEHDADGAWRAYVNHQLADPYPALFARLDALVLLAAPGFEVVQTWRTEQEAKLRARTGLGMSDAQVAVFIQHYERLTRWILQEMPGRADWTVRLDAARRPLLDL